MSWTILDPKALSYAFTPHQPTYNWGGVNLDFLVSRVKLPGVDPGEAKVVFSRSTSAKRRKGWLALVIAVSCYKQKGHKIQKQNDGLSNVAILL